MICSGGEDASEHQVGAVLARIAACCIIEKNNSKQVRIAQYDILIRSSIVTR